MGMYAACNTIHRSGVSRPRTQKIRVPHCWERVRKQGWEAPPFQQPSQALREELKEWKANLSIPQIELGEPKQTIACSASARKPCEPRACNKTLLGSLSEWLAAANQQRHTGTIKHAVTNRQTGCSRSVVNLKKKKAPNKQCAWCTLLPVQTYRFPLLTGKDTSHSLHLMINSSLGLFWIASV